MPADAERVLPLLRRTLRSRTAKDLARRYASLGKSLELRFEEPRRAGFWGHQRVDSGTAVLAVSPLLRRAEDHALGPIFWHEACHALHGAGAEEAGIHLWDLFFDDELSCYLAGEVIRLELGAAPGMDDISAAMLRSTAAFASAMLRQESNSSLLWEELADPVGTWTRRKEGLEPLKEHAAKVLSRVPVWRYRVRKVVGGGLIPAERLETLGYELDANERNQGGLEDIRELVESLDRRLAFFGGPSGAGHLSRLEESRRSAFAAGVHAEALSLQARYAELGRARLAEPQARRSPAPKSSEDVSRPPQADYAELQEAYERLKASQPGCCSDEPAYQE
ncbi:MAG: hypothetical protein HY924_14360 [Elusimicrobia bacterium]|nr:hypothetical protein [Elusimicrobiota bacterium]